jgi:hypothetical protein
MKELLDSLVETSREPHTDRCMITCLYISRSQLSRFPPLSVVSEKRRMANSGAEPAKVISSSCKSLEEEEEEWEDEGEGEEKGGEEEETEAEE